MSLCTVDSNVFWFTGHQPLSFVSPAAWTIFAAFCGGMIFTTPPLKLSLRSQFQDRSALIKCCRQTVNGYGSPKRETAVGQTARGSATWCTKRIAVSCLCGEHLRMIARLPIGAHGGNVTAARVLLSEGDMEAALTHLAGQSEASNLLSGEKNDRR